MTQTLESVQIIARVINNEGDGDVSHRMVHLTIEFPESELAPWLIDRILEQALPEINDKETD